MFNPARQDLTFTFQFQAEEGVVYQVQFAVQRAVWNGLANLTGPTGGGVLTFTDTEATNSVRMYRICIE